MYHFIFVSCIPITTASLTLIIKNIWSCLNHKTTALYCLLIIEKPHLLLKFLGDLIFSLNTNYAKCLFENSASIKFFISGKNHHRLILRTI